MSENSIIDQQEENKCCGRCNGVDDICIADRNFTAIQDYSFKLSAEGITKDNLDELRKSIRRHATRRGQMFYVTAPLNISQLGDGQPVTFRQHNIPSDFNK